MIAADPGMGKSLIALLWCMRHPEAAPVVIICPATVKWVWEREVKIHTGMRIKILEGTKPRSSQIPSNVRYLVINYDILYAWVKMLRRLKPQLVIVDESQYICTRTSRRTRAVMALCKEVPHILALSGTPLVNRPAELWPTLHLIKPQLYSSFWKFAHRHCRPRKTPWGWDVRGASRLPLLHRTMTKNLMVRYRKEDVLQDLPKKRRIVVPLDITGRAEYEKAVKDFAGWLRDNFGQVKANRSLRAEQLAQIGHLKRLAAQLKLKAVIAWVNDLLQQSEGKLLIFAIHKAIVSKLHDQYQGQCVVVDGSVTGRKRQQAIDQFLGMKQTRIMIGSDAAITGWSAKGVSTVVRCELPWQPGNLIQSEDRCHGIGRGNVGIATTSYLLVARGTIEERLVKVLQDKQKVIKQTLDGKGNGEDLNIFDMLCQQILEENKQ